MPNDSIHKPDRLAENRGLERRHNERRRHIRHPFTATVDAIEPKSQAKVVGRTSDISSGGCYIDTISPFPVGTLIDIRLSKEGLTFKADATVILAQVGMGMGVAFRSAEQEHIRILQKWLNELQGVPSTEAEASVSPQASPKPVSPSPANATSSEHHVLQELLLTLMRKGILSDDEGIAMIKKLPR
jgi:hypothetical protein